MLRRIFTFFKLDAALSIRDSVLVYSLVSPLILALVVRLVIPSVQSETVTMVVDTAVPRSVVERLAGYGEVETAAGPEAVRRRVAENDDVPGLYVDRDGDANGEEAAGYVLVLEGNEASGALEEFRTIVSDAIDLSPGPKVTVTDLQGQAPPVLEYGAAMLIVFSLFVGGILVGFNIVDEKETEVVRAMAVSPLRMLEYIAARSILAVLIAYAAGFGAAFIVLGAAVPVGRLAVSMAAALFVAVPFGFIVGAFADNQMTAFALIKLLMVVFVTIPFVSIFVPNNLQFLFYVFPNYWMFISVSHAVVGTGAVGYGLSLALSVVTGLLMVFLLLPRLRAGLRLR